MSTTSDKALYQLTFYVPTTHTQRVLAAVHAVAGAGAWPTAGTEADASAPPRYVDCAFITRGTGQFRPSADGKPYIGTPGQLERVDEDKVELVVVGRQSARDAVAALRNAHPYEVVAFFVVRCEDEFL